MIVNSLFIQKIIEQRRKGIKISEFFLEPCDRILYFLSLCVIRFISEGAKFPKRCTECSKGETGMKNNKKVIAIVALLLVAVIAFFAVRNLPKGEKAVDDNAVARSQEEEGDIHYIDDGAIALAGEAASTNTAGEAQATLALVNNQRAAGGLGGLYYGLDAIPQNWLESLKNKELFENLLD